MNFFEIKKTRTKSGVTISPDFVIAKNSDIMVRGKGFYAIWDEEKGMWSTDEYDVCRLVDDEMYKFRDKLLETDADSEIKVLTMKSTSSKSWSNFKTYVQLLPDNSSQLDTKLTFLNDKVKKSDRVSKRLPYSLIPGECPAYEELISTLYDPSEREKIEWAIGSIISGESVNIQKFLVLYGEAGAGKSTILHLIEDLFEGYYTTFDAKALGSNNNAFATEVFKSNPLVAIQHDGDLSRIEDNTKLNSIVSHEDMTLNEKYKASYTARINCFLFMGTNKPVKITDSKSGIIRRLIDVKPSGRLLSPERYEEVVNQIKFEHGAIASHCLKVYQSLGKNYYSTYKPIDMILKTDVFYNFVEANYFSFADQDCVTLTSAYEAYKQYCDDSFVEFKLPKHKFREELKDYFKEFKDICRIGDIQVRSVYKGFIKSKFINEEVEDKPENESKPDSWLNFNMTISRIDKECADNKAQYAKDTGGPSWPWDKVTTTLAQLNTTKLHYILFSDPHHIVIDFDLKDENKEKSLEKNMEAASKWPPTYAELSKSGKGIHLHYIYTGDPTKLSNLYSENIEVKVFTGKSALRRLLTKCNDLPIAEISSGLPLKGEKMINKKVVEDEKHLRDLIFKNLRKEIHAGTKPSVDFIYKLLDDAYRSGMHYDVSDLRNAIINFAANSTHNSDYCLKLVVKMPFKSEDPSEDKEFENKDDESDLVFFDIEVFPNLFLIVYKFRGPDKKCVRLFNPKPFDLEKLFKYKLVGFNNRRYDNHICYARYVGYSVEQLYDLSAKIVGKSTNAMFGEAYNLSYTDVYDFASAANKQSLKKFEIDLGLKHQECPYKWDKPVAEEHWGEVADYCENDVLATEAVFDHLKADWVTRKVLAKLSGLTYNDTTNAHSTKIIFGNDRNPQREFIYTDLSQMFPGYKFDNGVSTYKGKKTGEGGYVETVFGAYNDVALLDIASMHPSSIEALNLFGDRYTKKFSDIKAARIAIKHKDYDTARTILDGALAPFLDNPEVLEALPTALKTVINSIYGLTSATFDNKFRDPRNVDNIVAKRGALFMIDLKEAVEARGFSVIHIKTDSIKIPNATKDIINFVMEFGRKYGYNFEHEATYDRMCIVNNAVYIARYQTKERCMELYNYIPEKNEKHPGEWTATGAQFAQPYVFKTMFSKEPLVFRDLCEVKNVSTAIYLDHNEKDENSHDYEFVGKIGLFSPVKPGVGGALLVSERTDKDGNIKYNAVEGTKGFRWLESDYVKNSLLEESVDLNYFRKLIDDARESMGQYCNVDLFCDPNTNAVDAILPF